MKMFKNLPLFLLMVLICSCEPGAKKSMPVIGFVDAFEDATLAPARAGFVDALKKNGFSEDQKNIKIIYRNV